MKKLLFWSLVLTVGLIAAYIGSYVIARVSGYLNVDPDFRPPLLSVKTSETGEYRLYSPATEFFQLSAAGESILTQKRFWFGPARTVRYRGNYSQRQARELLIWILGKIPTSATKFSGSYSCAFYDDDIEQFAVFHLSEAEWTAWHLELLNGLARFARVDELTDSGTTIRADYGSSTGTIQLVYSDSQVTLSRKVAD